MSNLTELNAWRDLRITEILCWTPRVLNALKPHYDTLGEFADTPMATLRRQPNIGMLALNEIRAVIAQAVLGNDLSTLPEASERGAAAAVAITPTCGTCRWWGYDSAGPWVVSPRAQSVNVCGAHRREAGKPAARNVITHQIDWCSEHECLAETGDAEAQ